MAEVVMNRVRDSRFPKTVCAVVYQGRYRDTGCQFTFTCDGSLANKPRGEAWDRAKDVALNTMLGLTKPVTNKATHYHTDYVNPYWKAGMVETKVIGTHIFYRFPKTGCGMDQGPHRARSAGNAGRRPAAGLHHGWRRRAWSISTQLPRCPCSLVPVAATEPAETPVPAHRSRRRPSALTLEIQPDVEIDRRVRQRARGNVIDPRLRDRLHGLEPHPA